jgi:hypothetical protein
VSAAQEFIEQYRRAFAHAGVDALVECFAFPVQVVGVAEDRASVSAARLGTGLASSGLLGAYERLHVADVVPLAVEVREPIDAVAVVRVHWALKRETPARSTSSRRSTHWRARTNRLSTSRSHTRSCPS